MNLKLVRRFSLVIASAVLACTTIGVPAARAETHTVVEASGFFEPSFLTINVGDTVHFEFTSGGHTATEGVSVSCVPAQNPEFDLTASGDHTFNTPGTYDYFCRNHCGGGRGAITVKPPPEPTPTPGTPPPGLQPVPLGSEFRVNTSTSQNQWHPAVAPLPGGGFVVVWTSWLDGGVFGRRYGANGAPLEGEFYIGNADTATTPSVSTAPTGDFVVAWSSTIGISEGPTAPSVREIHDVVARRYDRDGNPIGGPFRVNTATASDHSAPSVAVSPDGGFIIAWQSDGQDGSRYGIFVRHYDASGAPVGAELQVNTYTAGEQLQPAVAVGPGGDHTVVWESETLDGSRFGIFGQRFDSTGNKVGVEFQVNTYTTSDQTRPAIAAGPQGQLFVVWQSIFQDGDDYGIYGQRYDALGNPVGAEFLVNSFTAGSQQRPAVAFAPTGESMVAWERYLQPGDLNGNLKDVFAQHYDANGDRFGSEFRVNTVIASYQDSPTVAGDSNGFVVLWNSNTQDGSWYGVFGQRFGASLQPPSPTPTPAAAILVGNDVLSLRHTDIDQAWCSNCSYCDCVASCGYYEGGSGRELPDRNETTALYAPKYGFAPPSRQKSWGFAKNQPRLQSGVGADPLPLRAINPGEPFPLLQFTSMNWPITGDYPTSLRITTSLHVQPPGEPAFDFTMCGIPFRFIETDNRPPCDPDIQRSSTACDDQFAIDPPVSFQVEANGKIWKLDVLGWDDPWAPGTLTTDLVVPEALEILVDLVAVLTVETPTPSPTPTSPPATATPTATPTPTNTPTPANTPTRTATPTATPTPTPRLVHIGDLDGSVDRGLLAWKAMVNISVHDGLHAPVAGAKVTGTWDQGGTSTSSCTTASNGRCTTTSGAIVNLKRDVTFKVKSVASTAGSYAPATNHDPDGDSNGTTIQIRR